MSFGVVANTLESRTGHKHPLSRTGSSNEVGPYVFGLHMVVVVADAALASQVDIVLNRRRSYFFVIVYLMIAECHPQDIIDEGSWSMSTTTRHVM